MVALVVALGFVVLLLAVLVAGLLRSHADILKALHDLGAGVGDPALRNDGPDPESTMGDGPQSRAQPITMGPTLPPGRHSSSAPTIAGVTPGGDALAVAPGVGTGLTLVAFLSTGCASCAGFWEAFGDRDHLGLPDGCRVVVVTKGPEREIPAEVSDLAPSGLTVLMSSDAWTEYEVPGSPFFVLVDGATGRRIGEGVANHIRQVAELVRRAELDAGQHRRPGRDSGVAGQVGIDGPGRESDNDRALERAGILPGDPSLYPTSLDDLYGPERDRGSAGGQGARRVG